ncbi:hypothetical protein ACFULT_26310 [Rhodococcus sp. NPDC057297]|uniref:hypothetical protein n=1 Tax=Rhodococcus sp. NPDC057297 TaxID=3346090 RepID=UPI00363687B7
MVTKNNFKKSRFATMRDEALKGYKDPEPYVIDEVDPPIVINIPATYEDLKKMAAIQDDVEDEKDPDAVPMAVLKHLCADGDFDRLTQVIDKWPPRLVKATFDDIFDYFSEVHNWDGSVDVEGKD